jgi:D-tagatose-1,6-bisphosphate aldolase subunit GatZ/KbaZ
MKSMRHAFRDCRDGAGQLLQQMVNANRSGTPVGIYSICSANRLVLEAGMIQAAADDTVLCIESTSNQVNQFGGYMGLTPRDFARYVESIAQEAGFPVERIILGGDHLGPHVWQSEPAESAMAKARTLVRDCVRAGYIKIHLDASMRCADDPGGKNTAPGDEVVTRRMVELCRAAEDAHDELPSGSPQPLYVIGTEVPVPGGEQNSSSEIAVTGTADVDRTVRLANEAFHAAGLESAWNRVIATVVQPGVDFSDRWVQEYDRGNAAHLRQYIENNWNLVFEAHSTDYQPGQALKELVEDHFAILKVGPWLTFAFREAVFALAAIEEEWLSDCPGVEISRIRPVLEETMIKNPAHWNKYYLGNEQEMGFARKYSYSDRSRYYWAQPEVQQALDRLFGNLEQNPAPLTLLSQYLPNQYRAVRRRIIKNHPADLVRNKVLEVMNIYAGACGMH